MPNIMKNRFFKQKCRKRFLRRFDPRLARPAEAPLSGSPAADSRPVRRKPTTHDRHRCRFDFEVGWLVRSPCRDCREKSNLPRCADACATLDTIQRTLSKGISSSRDCALQESYTVAHDNWKQK
jgi:hypothetical protein